MKSHRPVVLVGEHYDVSVKAWRQRRLYFQSGSVLHDKLQEMWRMMM